MMDLFRSVYSHQTEPTGNLSK
uniref:Uncharacterized protein n=1 Tax=Arundo donax TaxID=35708 RepID=A0A0A9BZN2_ARUDO